MLDYGQANRSVSMDLGYGQANRPVDGFGFEDARLRTSESISGHGFGDDDAVDFSPAKEH